MRIVSNLIDPISLPEDLSIPAEDWHQTPLRVRMVRLTLLKRLEALEGKTPALSRITQHEPLPATSTP